MTFRAEFVYSCRRWICLSIFVAGHPQNGRTDQKSEGSAGASCSCHCTGSNFSPCLFTSPCSGSTKSQDHLLSVAVLISCPMTIPVHEEHLVLVRLSTYLSMVFVKGNLKKRLIPSRKSWCWPSVLYSGSLTALPALVLGTERPQSLGLFLHFMGFTPGMQMS